MLLVPLTGGEEWRAPVPVASLKAFQTAFPKAPPSGAALELEALTARLGIDLAPRDERRDHPNPEAAKAYQAVAPAIRQYVEGQLQEAGESVDAPGEAVQKFLSEHDATLDAIVALATARPRISWDTDVAAGFYAPTPNVLGQVRLHLALAARALDEVRSQNPDRRAPDDPGNVDTRPEPRHAPGDGFADPRPKRFAHGRGPASEGRLARDRVGRAASRTRGFESFLAALQNDAWHLAGDPEVLEAIQGMTRVQRRFVGNLAARDPCGWTRRDLDQSWKAAASGEPAEVESMATMGSENSLDSLNRWHRHLLDAELTALVLEARGEKAASRDRAWPARLENLESSVCPGSFWGYQRSSSGDVTIVFEGRAPAVDRGLVLPLTFRSAPPPAATPAPQ